MQELFSFGTGMCSILHRVYFIQLYTGVKLHHDTVFYTGLWSWTRTHYFPWTYITPHCFVFSTWTKLSLPSGVSTLITFKQSSKKKRIHISSIRNDIMNWHLISLCVLLLIQIWQLIRGTCLKCTDIFLRSLDA